MLVTIEVASEFGPEGAGVLSEANVEVMPIFIGRVEPDLKRDPEAVVVSARCSADGWTEGACSDADAFVASMAEQWQLRSAALDVRQLVRHESR